MPAFETRTDSPGETAKYAKIHVSTGEETSGSCPESTQGLRPRHRLESNPERPPRNSHGDWPFLRPPERFPDVPVKNPEIHVSTGAESSPSGPDSTQGLRPRQGRERNPERRPCNSHGDWPFLRSPERVPEVPIVEMRDPFAACSEENPGRSCRIARGGALHRKARVEGSFPCLVGKEFPAFPSHLKRKRSPQESREELSRRATIPRVHQMSQSIPEEPVFPARPRLSRRGSTPNTVARGTALWDSLGGKPRGNATDPMIDLTEA
ncbi:hypothetical protein MJT46_018543 [Ovis ammon polii x Ovis aries]|nr:hypothetical protein MJT46_018543 [Ovis ammon polii x Ovis aries]